MWRWTSKTLVELMLKSAATKHLPRVSPAPPDPSLRSRPSSEHHQAHANGAVGTGILKLARAQKLRVHFVAIDRLESALSEVVLGGFKTIDREDRKSTRLNSSHMSISYAVFCLKKKKKNEKHYT